MWDDTNILPTGFRPVLPIPTGHDLRRFWSTTTWTTVTDSVLRTLRIPEYQKEFLFWPGIPIFLTSKSTTIFLTRTTEIVNKKYQFLFNDFYVISEEILMEYDTGHIYKKSRDGYIKFYSSGISDLLIFDFIEENYYDIQGYIRGGYYEDNESPLGGTRLVIAPLSVFPNEVTELLSLIDHEQLYSDRMRDEYGHYRSDYDDYGWLFPNDCP